MQMSLFRGVGRVFRTAAMLLGAVVSLSGCQVTTDEEVGSPNTWATKPLVDDPEGYRFVMMLPAGYELHFIGFSSESRFWRLSRVGVSGGAEIWVNGRAAFQAEGKGSLAGLCYEERVPLSKGGIGSLEWLRPRFIDGEKACGMRQVQVNASGEYLSVTETWVLCRDDSCWAFRISGDVGSQVIPGELIAVLDTIRFIPPVDPEPDFRLGEADVVPSASPTR